MASAVEKRPSQVPALVNTPALEFTAEDVTLPRIKMAQFMSSAVQDQLVTPGDLFASVGADDPQPTVLDQPVLFHVIALRKGKSYSESPGAELQRFDYGDPDAPAGAWVTWDYTVALPEVDPDTPYRMLFTKTGTGAARTVNTTIDRSGQPHYELAFELTTVQRENAKGKFYVPRPVAVDAKPENVEAVIKLAEHLSSNETDSAGTSATNQPDI